MKDKRSLPIEATTTIEKVEEYFAFANPILCIDPNDPYMAEHYPPARVATELSSGRRALFLVRDEGAIVAGAMAKVFGEGDRELRRIEDPDPIVLFEYAAVREDSRRQGVWTRLFQAREAWAREHGFRNIVMEVELTAEASLYAAFKNGFVATHLLPPSLGIVGPYLILRKNL